MSKELWDNFDWESVREELDKAVEKHPSWDHVSLLQGASYVAEEAGELLRAANNMYDASRRGDNDTALFEWDNAKTEARQTIAVAIRLLMDMDSVSWK